LFFSIYGKERGWWSFETFQKRQNVKLLSLGEWDMKKLIILFVILSLFSTFTLSEIKNIKIDGSLETLSINLDNSTDLTKTDPSTGLHDDLINQTKARLILGLSADLTDKVSGKILVYKNNRLWGSYEEDVHSILYELNIANAYVIV
jgi:hypothetical protein